VHIKPARVKESAVSLECEVGILANYYAFAPFRRVIDHNPLAVPITGYFS